MEQKRKGSKYWMNKQGYIGVRADLDDPATALWILTECIDQVKVQVRLSRRAMAEAAKKQDIEISKNVSKNFVQDKCK
jgi:hypothetical protein